MELFVRVDDVDPPEEDNLNRDDTLVAIFIIPVNATQINKSPTIFRDIKFQGSFLGLSFNMTCSLNFYGKDCTSFCVQRNDAFGHYVCGKEGNFECLTGYQDPFTNCTNCSLAPGCGK